MSEIYDKLRRENHLVDENYDRMFFSFSKGVLLYKGIHINLTISSFSYGPFNGVLNRKLPDIEYILFYENGLLHNKFAPAKYIFDTDTKELKNVFWYIEGKSSTYTKWAKDSGIKLNDLSEEDQWLINMKFGK